MLDVSAPPRIIAAPSPVSGRATGLRVRVLRWVGVMALVAAAAAGGAVGTVILLGLPGALTPVPAGRELAPGTPAPSVPAAKSLPAAMSTPAALPLPVPSPWASTVRSLAGPVPVRVIDVTDGDTVVVEAQIWLDQTLVTRVRVAGVDTPEIRRPDCEAERLRGHQARAYTVGWLAAGADTLTLIDIAHDKYAGRTAAQIRRGDGRSLGTDLLAAGLAVPADRSGSDASWC